MTMKICTAFAMGLITAVAIPAHAGLLGNTVRAEYLFPNLGTVVQTNDVVVSGGIELPNYFGQFDVDLSDAQIRFQWHIGTSITSGAFNGFRFTDLNSTIPAFTGVTIDAATTMTNFTAGGLSFDADHVFMNWQGVSHTPNDVLILNLQCGEVPEPATLALLGLGLAGIGFSRRKQ